jgi:hypothetical protein
MVVVLALGGRKARPYTYEEKDPRRGEVDEMWRNMLRPYSLGNARAFS